jgi:hypothetical protein
MVKYFDRMVAFIMVMAIEGQQYFTTLQNVMI